ncbi:hypothetical protein FRC12_011463 [Ceratobasidium sp. 428]|nr:hypothetical protein FRC12_011463 [Ceratobasidium sp. 428]
MGGTHQNPEIPSIKIAIQLINHVALGHDFGVPYMFLELLQNPHFERGNASRSTTGNSKEDARNSRTRHSALDPIHERVAPYTSRWLKLSFYRHGAYPGRTICILAGLPLPDMNPPLEFNKLEMYSLRNVLTLEKWLRGDSLSWEVAFQCEALFRNGVLVPQELLLLSPLIERLAKESPSRACDALMSLRSEMEGAGAPKKLAGFGDQAIIGIFKKLVAEGEKKTIISQLRDERSQLTSICHHVKITPTAVFLTGPFSEQSNRIIRRYPGFESYFIRVSFTDEGDTRTHFDREVNTDAFAEDRVGGFLKNGLQIANRYYALLAYSQSGFREHRCFFSSRFVFQGSNVTPESIRTSLGDFTRVIHCPARYGARMSQAFTATYPSIIISKSVILQLRELETEERPEDETLQFSDGCGTISRELAKEVWEGMNEKLPESRRRERHEHEPIPSVFQIRIGGYKGMVRLDPRLTGRKLGLRPSMDKFEAPNDLSLEIAWVPEQPTRCILNRTLVMLMWTNGVESSVFENLMASALELTTTNMETFEGVAKLLVTHRLGNSFLLSSTFHNLARLQLGPDQPGVRTTGLHKLMNALLYRIKVSLKHKANIPVPGGHTLVGVCDEENYLRPREIYACVQYFDRSTKTLYKKYLKGRMLVTRSPVIHPGDAQILWAIGSPPLGSPFAREGGDLPNCVVFSTRGPRPVPNMLGGGDLAPHSTIEDVADFMVKAVDFPKTGKPVPPEEIRKPKYGVLNPKTGMSLQPDWQAGHGRDPSDGQCYECPSVLGRLFRAVQLPEGNPARESVDAPKGSEAIRRELAKHVGKYAKEIRDTYQSATSWIRALFSWYTSELNHICVSHTVSSESSERVSEVEVMLGTVLEPSDTGRFVDRMKRLTGDLTTFVRLELRGGKDGDPYDWLARAWRAYQMTSDLGDMTFGAFSFSWIALGSVFDALNKLDENFLPPTGPINPPFPPTTTHPDGITEDLDELPPFDLDNWDWDDDPETILRATESGTGHSPASTPPRTPQTGSRSSSSGGSSPGGGGQRNKYPNGGGNGSGGLGSRRGWGKASSPRSYGSPQANGSSSGGSVKTNRTVRGRGFKIVT